MTPAELIAAFEALAEAPDGAVRLRDLILQLALRGKLVPQDPDDGRANSLPLPVQEGGASKKPEAIAELPGSPHPWGIPKSWAWTRTVDLGELSPRNDCPDAQIVAFCPMPTIPTEFSDSVRSERREWSQIKKGYTHFADGDVVVAKITPCFQNRKSCVMQEDGAGTTELHVIRPNTKRVCSRYLLLFYKSPYFVRDGVAQMTGTAGQQRVPRDYFANAPLPLPPLAEQHRIVARVDELMGLLDRLEAARIKREATRAAARDSVLAALREADSPEAVDAAWTRFAQRMDDLLCDPADIAPLRQTVLELAVRGRLVRQDPKDEPATLLLDRITASKQQFALAGKISKCRPRTPVAAADRLAGIPESWVWCRLGDVLVDIEGGWSPAALGRPREGEEWGVLKVSACSWGRFLPDENKALAPGTVPREHLEVRSGDFLISRANTAELVARSVVVGVCPPRLMLSDKTLRMKPADGVVVDYLNLANLSAYARAQYEAKASGTSASMKNVAQEVIREVVIPLPPAAEQLRIVARVDELMGLLDRLERRLTAAKATQAAFAGAAVHHVVA